MTNTLLAVTVAYKSAVLALMLAEAGVVTERLDLPEERPIRLEHLTEVFVGPPALNETFGGPNGTIRTKRHVFAFARNGKLTTLGRLDLLNPVRLSEKELNEEYRKRAVPLAKIDTNAAWQAMLPRLKAGILDVERLNRECEFRLKHLEWAGFHVPKYTAQWTKDGENVAAITILLPENVLLSFLIDDTSFNLRPGFRLSSTNVMPMATDAATKSTP